MKLARISVVFFVVLLSTSADAYRLKAPVFKTPSFIKNVQRKVFSSRPRSTWLGRFIRRVNGHSPKEITAEQAASAKLINPGNRIYIPVGHAVALSVLDALGKRAQLPQGGLDPDNPVELVGLTNTAPRSIFDREGKVVPRSLFIGPNMRDPIAAGRGSFVPVFLHRVPRLIREGKIPVDTALLLVSPPDPFGYVSLGSTAASSRAAIERAKVVIAEVNPNVPHTFGATRIHISQIDYIVRANDPLRGIPRPEIGDIEQRIAINVVRLIPKKPVLQFGIGAIPDAVASELARKGRRDLRIYSEMISDGIMDLVKAGAIRGKIQYSFALGSEEFLKWMDKNPRLYARTTDVINNPNRLARTRRLISINSALRIDLRGQINAQYIKDTWYSGVGGQVDFMRGAMASKGGHAILALPSTSTITDEHGNKKIVSRIVPRLGEEDVVTTSMHDVQFVVTEWGIANLDGRDAEARARALIRIAHPDFREQLTRDLGREIATRAQAEQRQYEDHMRRENTEQKDYKDNLRTEDLQQKQFNIRVQLEAIRSLRRVSR